MSEFDDPSSTHRGQESRGSGRGKPHAPRHPALTDQLTGLPNRLSFDVVYEVVFEMGDRGVPLTVLLFELDEFEEFLLREGEGPGVVTLKEFGTTLAEHIRKTDLIARMDRSRFVLLLLDSNLQGGLVAADRFEDLLSGFTEDTGLTFSVGVASYREGMTDPAELLDAAGRALEAAQAAGGGTVKVPADLDRG